MDSKLTAIVGRFAYEGTVSEIKPLGEGLINDTYKVKTAEQDKPDYVLQRVNHVVFPDVNMVMRNIDAVTSHIRKKLEAEGVKDIDRRVLRFMPARWSSSQAPSRSKPSIPKAAAPPDGPSVTSRRCWPIFPSSWARPSRTSTTWSSDSVSCEKS